MKNKIGLIILLFGFLTLIVFGCEEDEKSENFEELLIGMWIEQEPYTDGVCDSIIFNEDNTIGLYYPLTGWDYKIASKDSLVIINPFGVERCCYYELIERDKLIVYNFLDRTITNQVKDITFKR